ncbi:MAG: DUF6776 family protein [Thiolinea sp.]
MALEYRFDHRGNVELQNGQSRSYCWLYFLIFILLQLGVAAWLYFSGYLTPTDSEGSVQALSLRGKMDEQERLLNKQADDITRLESQVISAQRSEKIQQAANESLRKQLGVAETALAESRERLLLYEAILQPQSPDKGLNVLHLGIKQLLIDDTGKKLPHDRYYQYYLILTNIRGGSDDSLIEGTFNLKLNGEQNKKQVSLKLQDIMVNNSREEPDQPFNRFSLKYYQGLEGNIELPEDFVPEQVIVELLPAAEAGKKVTRQFEWNSFKLSNQSITGEE